MCIKSDTFKAKHGCKSCEFEGQTLLSHRCKDCKVRRGSGWTKKKPVKVYCECCGAEKHD